jgi:hypothetical protein
MYMGLINDVRQAEIHAAEPLVPEPSAFEVEMAIEKLYFYMPRLSFLILPLKRT